MKKLITLLFILIILITPTYAYTVEKTVLSKSLTTTVDKDTKVTIRYNEIPGYDFTNWTTTGITLFDATDTQQIFNMPENNVTLTANVAVTSYTISYNLNGGTASNPTSYNINSNAITLTNPTKNGCTFLGWTGSNGATPQTTVTIPKGSTGNKVYTARWSSNEYTVTVTKNNGGTVTPGTSTVNYGSNLTFNITANTGYTISNIKLNGTNQSITNNTQMSYALNNITADKTFAVTFAPITYTIAYTLNGGTVSGNPTSYTIETSTITLKNPTKSGYTFSGWIGSNGSTPQTNVTIPQGSTGNKTYTAVFNENDLVITFNANGGTGSMSPQYVSKNVATPLTANTFTYTGKTFAGWAESSGGSVVYANGASITTTTDKTLYAKWVLYGDVNMDGSVTLADSTRLRGVVNGSVNVSEICSEAADVNLDGTLNTIDVLAIKYHSNSVNGFGTLPITNIRTITFNSNGGTGTMDMDIAVSGVAKILPTNTFTAPSGKVFGGWIDGATTGDVAYKDGASITTTTNKTLYAKWVDYGDV
ncbi:MAG: InlB B-repeat-containing protein, partial [Clostridia bacterium]|nr:InlB B-repeat-containing protein [Clostridia bacterium]